MVTIMALLLKWRIQRYEFFHLPFPWGKFHESFSVETAPLYRLLGFGLFVLSLFALNHFAYKIGKIWFLKSWWDVGDSGRNATLRWKDVFILASLRAEHDPIQKTDKDFYRPKPARAFFVYLCSLFCVGVGFAVVVDYLVFPHVPNLLLDNRSAKLNALLHASGNLTAYLALTAAVITIAFTYHQLRAKVRADARMHWIEQLRALMAEIIEAIGALHAGQEIDMRKFDERRLKLELMLNPSEKDHRLLAYLIRACVIPAARIEIDEHLVHEIRSELRREVSSTAKSFTKGNQLLWKIIARHGVPNNTGRRRQVTDKAISYIVILSHVILKREWEQVKWTR